MMKKKSEKDPPHWIENLKVLMEARNLNPRRLSLKSGLNATAVRDMLDGRARFPRYDTVEALARSLEVTPAQLMGGTPATLAREVTILNGPDPLADDDLNLLTEIIARLQEVSAEQKQVLTPREFAAMVTAIYRNIQENREPLKSARSGISPSIDHLITYETLRRRMVANKA
jgi:transcriptional regulator with XRE-family HTH domain